MFFRGNITEKLGKMRKSTIGLLNKTKNCILRLRLASPPVITIKEKAIAYFSVSRVLNFTYRYHCERDVSYEVFLGRHHFPEFNVFLLSRYYVTSLISNGNRRANRKLTNHSRMEKKKNQLMIGQFST